MTSPINSGSTPITGTGDTTTPSSAANKQQALDQNAFLKLLVAQLKYQDPSNPSDATQFLTQTAQFTQVEKLSQIADAQQSMVNAQLMLGASGMVGRTVTYAGADGADVSGVVSSAKFSGSTPTLRVGDTDVPLSSVKEVRQTT